MYNINDYQKAFGLSVRKIRRELSLTQEELAVMCNINQHYISEIEAGHRNVTLFSIVNIANNLNIRLSNLFTLTEEIMNGL